MTDLAGMPSYFWLTSSRLRKPLQDDVPYTTQALSQDLLRVQNAWDECQSHRERDAIYSYLTAVFDLVAWWAAEDCAVSRGHRALKLEGVDAPNADEPFAAIILATADREKVDKRTRSKWSRVLRYAMEYKPSSEPLRLRSAQGWDQRMCGAIYPLPRPIWSKLSIELYQAWMR